MTAEVEDRSYDRIDRWVGIVLVGGLLFSIAVMILGLILSAIQGTGVTHVLPLDRVLPQLAKGRPAAVLDTGILLMFAAPLAGVVTALIGFIDRRDARFTGVTAALLVLLVIGFAIALR